jgi:hypothetical protein
MATVRHFNGNLSVPSALLFDHDEARAGLVRAKRPQPAIPGSVRTPGFIGV